MEMEKFYVAPEVEATIPIWAAATTKKCLKNHCFN